VASLPCALYLAAWSAVQESPRWLLVSGRKVCLLPQRLARYTTSAQTAVTSPARGFL